MDSRTFVRHGHLSDTDICPTTEIRFSDKNPKTDICPKVGQNYAGSNGI